MDAGVPWFIVDFWQGNDKLAERNERLATIKMRNNCVEKGKKREVSISVSISTDWECKIEMEDKKYKEKVEYIL